MLVCGAVLGLMSLGPHPAAALPAGLILFREFAVSALREVTAGKGVKLPVTLLAKWKTTLQLTALGWELVVASWAAFNLPSDPSILGPVTITGHALMWLAAVITLITGAQYWDAAHRHLRAEQA